MSTLTKTLILFFAIACSVASFSQSPQLYWQKTFGGSLSETRPLVRSTSDKGCILAGFSFSTDGDIPSNAGAQDCAFFKLDACGNRQWTKIIGWNNLDLVYGLNEIPGGGYYFSGASASNTIPGHHGGMDGIIGKLDAGGNLSWIKTFGGSSNEVLFTNVILADSSCITAGHTSSTNGDGGPIVGWQ